jgi:hypothetical protein
MISMIVMLVRMTVMTRRISAGFARQHDNENDDDDKDHE